jgi:hypothetical protein
VNRILQLAFLILCISSLARAQQKAVLTAAAASCAASNASCLIYGVDQSAGAATFTVSANASGNTLQFEASGDNGTTWVALSVTPSNSSTTVTSTTSTGTWQANVAGYTQARIRMSTLVGGTSTVSIITSIASARGGGGGATVNLASPGPIGATTPSTGTFTTITGVGLSFPAVTITQTGTQGTSQYEYAVVGTDSSGLTRTVSQVTTLGNATLNSSNFNVITVAAWLSSSLYILPVGSCNVYRIFGGTTQGKIGTIASCAGGGSLNDTGLAGDSTAPPVDTSGEVTSGGIIVQNIRTGAIGTYVVVDGSVYAKTAAGVQAAINSLIDQPGTVILTPGRYSLGATGLTISHGGQSLVCIGGKDSCRIEFGTGLAASGTALTISASGSEIFRGEIGNLYFYGIGDTTNQKIAIKIVDGSQYYVHDIHVEKWTGNSGSGTTPSIGILSQGRELTHFARMNLFADRPFAIDTNPNSTITFDAYEMSDIYMIPLSTESCIVVTPGARITHWTMDGTNTCAGGVSALLWNDTTAAGLSKSININNYHQEQSTGGTSTYAFNLTRSNAGAQQIQDIIFDNDESDGPNDSGFFLQRTTNAMIRNSLASSTAGVTSVNADSTNINTQAYSNYFNTGGTYTNASVFSNVASNYFGTIIMPDSQGIQWLGDSFLWYNSGGTQYLRDQTNGYMAAAFGQNHTSITFDATTPFSSGTHTAPSFTSSVATGTAPLTVTSTTTVPNLTVSNHPKVQSCGTTSTCSHTALTTAQIIVGSAPLVSGTPSTVTITGFSPAFTSTTSYDCNVTDETNAANNLLKVVNTSASSITITGPATNTDTISYVCIGN